MKNTGKMKITTPSDREIVITREFDAPRRLVWDAMTTPQLIKRWLFQPPGWTMTACEEDLRVGGKFRWAWNGPDGKEAMVMHGAYREVVPPQRIVRTETFDMGCDMRLGEQIASIALAESPAPTGKGVRTRCTITLLMPSKEARDGMLASGMEQGMSVGYDQMEEMLAESVARSMQTGA